MTDSLVHSVALMGTVVTIQVVGHGATRELQAERAARVERAVDWFRMIEQTCTRFNPASEVRQLGARIGEPVPVSELLWQVVQFALALAAETGGAFDPTVGHEMEARGFNQEYRTGRIVPSGVTGSVSYRDVVLDPSHRTITLLCPLVLDLGAVAKGLAVDAAARELAAVRDFAIDAGGDLYLGGCNADGEPWSVGIRHPRDPKRLLDSLRVTDAAVCTSGDYEERGRSADGGHHIMDPRNGRSATGLASATVVAPSAMVADGLATAAFVLGPVDGIDLLQRNGVRGVLVTPALERFTTS